MSMHFYTMLKVWRHAGHDVKSQVGKARASKPSTGTRTEGHDAIYAAGIACAGQVDYRVR